MSSFYGSVTLLEVFFLRRTLLEVQISRCTNHWCQMLHMDRYRLLLPCQKASYTSAIKSYGQMQTLVAN